MPKIKSHKTVEQIAKKHRLEVSFIQKQLDMGEPIEHEHTKDHELAKDIALQHLDEIPDYYTRLKKMEASAKKEHKKFRDVKEDADSGYDDMDSPIHMPPMNGVHVDHEKRYCPRCKEVQKRSECKYGAICWDLFSLPEKLKEEYELYNEAGSLHHWFQGSSGKTKSGKRVKGWVQADGSPCANEPGETKTPKCFSSARLSALKRKGKKGESLIKSAVRRKRQEDPGQQSKSGAAKPTNVQTFAKGRKSKDYVKPEPGLRETMEIQEAQKDKPGKGSGTKDACYHKVKSRFKVFPSAYASGALVQCRKKGAANWGTKSEETMHEEERYCPLCDKRETRSQCSYGEKTWDKVSVKDEEYSMARSELQTITNAVKKIQARVGKGEGDLEAWVQSKITKAADYIDTAADYITSGEMEESVSLEINPTAHKTAQKREKIRNLKIGGTTEGERNVASKKLGATPDLPKIKEEKLVDKITNEIVSEKCWVGYKRKKRTAKFAPGSCVKSENVTIEDADGNTFAEVVDLIKPEPIKGFKSQVDEATRLQAQTGNVIAVTLLWRGKYYSLKMFFPQIKTPSRQEINDELQKVYPGSKVVYHSVSEIQSGQPLIQPIGFQGGSSAKPGSNKNYVKPMGEEVEIDEDWQSVNRKDRTAGLSQKAVDAYRRENPGSKLQTAVTEKNPSGKRAKRRASFCRRMKGMKSKLTSAQTARDPDSNINKALRRWNCN
jgi:ribosomal protein S24E